MNTARVESDTRLQTRRRQLDRLAPEDMENLGAGHDQAVSVGCVRFRPNPHPPCRCKSDG